MEKCRICNKEYENLEDVIKCEHKCLVKQKEIEHRDKEMAERVEREEKLKILNEKIDSLRKSREDKQKEVSKITGELYDAINEREKLKMNLNKRYYVNRKETNADDFAQAIKCLFGDSSFIRHFMI